ncbi:hypothetical protein H8959_013815 [Pygathrix nigripes]
MPSSCERILGASSSDPRVRLSWCQHFGTCKWLERRFHVRMLQPLHLPQTDPPDTTCLFVVFGGCMGGLPPTPAPARHMLGQGSGWVSERMGVGVALAVTG